MIRLHLPSTSIDLVPYMLPLSVDMGETSED
jgi:hypothetical protein